MPTIGLLGGHAIDEVPASHRDLVECPPVAALTTVTADGYPQTSVVWCDFDGECVGVNTMRGFAKERNMRRDPRVTLLCYDPRQPLRYLEVRGAVVEMTEDGARPTSRRARLEVRRAPDPLLRRLSSRHGSPRPRSRSCAGSVRPMSSRSTRRPRRVAMTALVATGTGPDPIVAPRPPDPADLRRADHDGRRRPAPVEPGLGRSRRRVRPGQHDARAAEGPQPPRQRRRSACWSSIPTTPAASSRSGATRSWSSPVPSTTSTSSPARTPDTRRYYGSVYPVEQRELETRVICRIHARRITLDAIHA